jgi:outer membrane immunogenic protein
MKWTITWGVGVLALAGLTLPSAAADLPMKAPMMVPPPVSWNGCYLGVNAGGVWGNSKSTWTAHATTGGLGGFTPPAAAALDAAGTNKITANGFTGGGQVGCNWQTSAFVFGAEADINYTGIDKIVAVGIPAFGGVGVSTGVQSKWLSTIRGRLGVLPAPEWMIYITGGLAIANVQFADAAAFNLPVPSINAASSDDTTVGWTAGGGVEWMFAPKWSFKVEGLYVDLGTKNFTSINTFSAPATIAHHHTLTETLARAGINWHF